MNINKLILSFILFLSVLCIAHSQKCSVTIEGHHFDLSKLIRSDQDYQFTNPSNGDIYYFNICNSTVGTNPCGNEMVAYKYDRRTKKCLGLGSNREYYSIHGYGGDSGPSVIVSYRGGDQIPNNPRSRYELSYVFECDPNSGIGEPNVLEPNEYGVVVVQWKSKYGCLAAYSQLIVNRDYDDFINIKNQINTKQFDQTLQYQKQDENVKIENSDQVIEESSVEKGDIKEDDYFVNKNHNMFNQDNHLKQNKVDYNTKYKQINDEQDEQEVKDEQGEQNESEYQNDEQNESQVDENQSQGESENINNNSNYNHKEIVPIDYNKDKKVTNQYENLYSPAFIDKVIPGIKDLDKLNINNNNNKRVSMYQNDKQNEYLEILKKTYKEQNQFVPPENNDQKVHKNDEDFFQ